MGIYTRMAEQYERIRHLLTGGESPEEVMAFTLGLLDGELGIEVKQAGPWYKQGHKHGVMGDAIDEPSTTIVG